MLYSSGGLTYISLVTCTVWPRLNYREQSARRTLSEAMFKSGQDCKCVRSPPLPEWVSDLCFEDLHHCFTMSLSRWVLAVPLGMHRHVLSTPACLPTANSPSPTPTNITVHHHASKPGLFGLHFFSIHTRSKFIFLTLQLLRFYFGQTYQEYYDCL